ncbi:MAG: hypothetical protein AAF389_14760 [Gemmatimonadota bacterium]
MGEALELFAVGVIKGSVLGIGVVFAVVIGTAIRVILRRDGEGAES